MNPRKTTFSTPGRARRLAAYGYELLPLLAILFGAGAVALVATGGEAVSAGHWGFRAYLMAWIFGYFVIPWRRGGQTIAMRAWRLHVLRPDGRSMSWSQAGIRFAIALLGWIPLGLGHWWFLFDPHQRTWHDMAAGTVVLQLED